jgi:rhodanese-related sulfurtransferase
MKERAGYILIDVREQEEWDQGHIEGAQLWPLSKIMQGRLPDLPTRYRHYSALPERDAFPASRAAIHR